MPDCGIDRGPVALGKRVAAMFCSLCCAFGGFRVDASDAGSATMRERFHNNYPHEARQSFWLWKWEQLREGLPQPPPGGWNIPFVKTDAAALRANVDRPTLTWIGHASFLLQLGGMNVLLDPQFSQ